MSTIKVTRQVEAPVGDVFETISDIRNFSKAVPDIVDVKFLSEIKSGVGTKFKETREFNGREAATVLEVTELVENDHIRIVSDTQGTIWDSLFTVTEKDGGCELTLEMEARPYKFLSKLMVPLMKGFVKKALEKDMDAVKGYCEN
ncbi:MAG: SRPBCC family protein [Balneolaceae bacterium]|nr:SRPBCC family protein [Balneolaceae bacterium]MDR9407398.1 SRPBCC family protein [Balneolaceae bacterium]